MQLRQRRFRRATRLEVDVGMPAAPAVIFAVLRSHDVLLHHPYGSFGAAEAFRDRAATDPDVLMAGSKNPRYHGFQFSEFRRSISLTRIQQKPTIGLTGWDNQKKLGT